MLNHAAQSYFFKANNFLNPTKIIKMNPETKKDEQHPHVHDAIKLHTKLMFTGKYPCLHKTPISEESFVAGYLHGLQAGVKIGEEIVTQELAPTVFLQDETKEKIVLDEENIRTLHY